MKSLLRRKQNKFLETPETLKLFDFLQKSKKKRNEQNSGSGLRLPKNVLESVTNFYPQLNCQLTNQLVRTKLSTAWSD